MASQPRDVWREAYEITADPLFSWRDTPALRTLLSGAGSEAAAFFETARQADAAGHTLGSAALLAGMVHVAAAAAAPLPRGVYIEPLERALDGVLDEHFPRARPVFGRVRHRILRELAGGAELPGRAHGRGTSHFVWATALAVLWSASRGAAPAGPCLPRSARRRAAVEQVTYVFARYLGDAYTRFVRAVIVLDAAAAAAVLPPSMRAMAEFYVGDVCAKFPPGGDLPPGFVDPVYAVRV